MPPPDKRRPFPDKAHEAIATWVEGALADLKTTKADVATTRGNGNQHGADIGDALLLVDALFELVDALLADTAALNARVTELEQPLP